jgi:K(+)-stimulated pyrophosphate-energized sodium pump
MLPGRAEPVPQYGGRNAQPDKGLSASDLDLTLGRGAPLAGAAGLLAAVAVFRIVSRRPTGTGQLPVIAGRIEQGAMAFLRRQYRVLLPVLLMVAALLTAAVGWRVGVTFILGGVCSLIAGFIGMRAATKANVRTAEAARTSGPASALHYGLFTEVIAGVAMGASSIALFARVGGGIYTKAADVGADLVGKVEAGIPEDDPRNPAVIADNVGDIAGMGADIFESYFAATVSAAVVGATGMGLDGPARLNATLLPFGLIGAGLVASFAALLSMRWLARGSAAMSLRLVQAFGAALFLLIALGLVWTLDLGIPGRGAGLYWAILAGTLGGVA